MLEYLQDLAPLGSAVSAVLDHDGQLFTCSVEVFQRRGSIVASSSHTDPVKTLERTEEAIPH
jgi:hypothetical protein